MFSEPKYISVGDDFDKKVAVPDRNRGGQFKTSPAKKGKGPDALFDKKVKTLSEGDKYVDPGVAEKRKKMEQSKKKLTPEGFKFTNPGTKSSGKGGDWGCFAKHKHESDHPEKKGPPKNGPAPKNIVTNPARKGTYGTPGTELGKGDEYKYTPDPYEGERRRELQQAKAASSKFIGGPFRAACKANEFFDGQPNLAASKIYTIDRALPPKKQAKRGPDPVVTVPFKPSSPPKRGLQGTLSKPLEYKEDPYDAREKAEAAARKKNKPAVTWKPVSVDKSLPVKSIAYNQVALSHG
eukprot:NODE_2255_length_1102_cov_117.243077_g2237_i0.p1 GENE.NODE_2255_length_1102_cov_117.243077_g2237_i0~~NODE_2255_length_1102_cov_117.243077_g2237_i0.p1  ORF type:complete len:294 (+),score=59.35 NODE_2255_length_1102_cov_117.243077_g2237_i0:118-999(+)